MPGHEPRTTSLAIRSSCQARRPRRLPRQPPPSARARPPTHSGPLLDLDLGLGQRQGQDSRLSNNLANNNNDDCPTSCIDHVIGNDDEPQSDNANTLPNLATGVATANSATPSLPLNHHHHHHHHDGKDHLQAKGGAPTEATGHVLTGGTGNLDGSSMSEDAETAAMSLQEIGGWLWNSPLDDDYTAHHDAGNSSDSTSVHPSSGM